MSFMTRAALLTLILLGAGCAYLPDGDPAQSRLVCRSDAECAEGQVCFADGCGDPGQNIVVEVTPNPKAGLHAQDFVVENLRPQQNLELFGAATLQGEVRREALVSTPGAETVAYSSPVSLRVSGESLLIPGVTRRYEATLVPDNGSYQLAVGSGSFTVTLLTADPQVPPVVDSRRVEPGGTVPLDFVLPAATSLVRLAGKVVRQGTVLVDADLEVQAVDESLRPLSQRVPVTRGTGEFVLALSPSATARTHVLVQVTAPRTGELVPQKTFTVDPRPGVTAPLELGDYGEPVRVTGRVVGLDGRPVAGATVALRGQVGGGGTFHGPLATTGPEGRFTVDTLPAAPGGTLSLVVVPPLGATAGLTVQPVEVPRTGAVLPDVVCPNRRLVRGTIHLPGSTHAAPGVRVAVEPVAEVPGWPRPPGGGEALGTTGDNGDFQLRLDPAVYRVDFIPAENLPRVSLVVTVLPGEDTAEQRLATFALQRGRTLRGRVTEGTRALPYASLRFYRAVTLEGRPSSVLLAQTVSDHAGRYTALIPVR